METVLIQGKDFAITNIETDSFGRDGCETCNYGSEYTTEIIFSGEKTDGSIFAEIVSRSQMYSYPQVSIASIIVYFAHNLDSFLNTTLEDFLKEADKQFFGDNESEW